MSTYLLKKYETDVVINQYFIQAPKLLENRPAPVQPLTNCKYNPCYTK